MSNEEINFFFNSIINLDYNFAYILYLHKNDTTIMRIILYGATQSQTP